MKVITVKPEILEEVIDSLREGGFIIKEGEIIKTKQLKRQKNISKMFAK